MDNLLTSTFHYTKNMRCAHKYVYVYIVGENPTCKPGWPVDIWVFVVMSLKL